MQPNLFSSSGFAFLMHFVVRSFSSLEDYFRKPGAKIFDVGRITVLKFIDFSRQIYKVVSLKRKNKIIEMNKEQVGSSAMGYNSIIMLIALFVCLFNW